VFDLAISLILGNARDAAMPVGAGKLLNKALAVKGLPGLRSNR